ncbi:hypothetical protein MSG28_003439 [Choristoneura fumiferana]|uniref:Uncharacterized protein n=1 Tax=Choristoneura fumiferana TaxID=7141 RepID=A0ACC0KFZ7_CHOFU|nr:hypothetical protein MSG28_003439 [Choristoneura fumiferana]
MPEMELVITHNKQIIKTATKEMNMKGSQVKSIEEFQQLVNATITAAIEERGGNQDDIEDLSEESSESEEDANPVTPKKRRQ